VGLVDDLREAGTASTCGSRVADLGSHDDRRVRVLVARHPALPASSFAALAADREPAVRAALASTHPLDSTHCAALLRDSNRRVRQAVLRYQDVPFKLLKDHIEAGGGSAAVLQRMRLHLRDPSLAAVLINQPRWAHFAAEGTFRYDDLEALLARRGQPWVLSRLAAVGTFDDRSGLLFAKYDNRAVQESIAGRPDLSARLQRRIAFRGGVWSRAAILGRRPTDALTRVLGRRGFHRVLRRVRAEVTTSKTALAWLSLSPHWDVKAAVAANPKSGRFVLRQLARSGSWAVGAALARRADIDERSIGRLVRRHLLVRLLVAANPAIPPSSLQRLVLDGNVYVAGVAAAQASARTVEELLNDPKTPAWVLRRVAVGDRATANEKERILVWLALGGGNGDPGFDPFTCTGSPGPSGYRLEPGGGAPWECMNSPLWRTRVLAGQGRESLDHNVVAAMSKDPHVAVRRVAAGYRSRRSLRELRFDAEPSVSTHASTTLQSTESPAPKGWAVGAVIAVALIGLGLATRGSGGSTPDSAFVQPPPLADAPSIVQWKIDPTSPLAVVQVGTIRDEPRWEPSCTTAAGAEIWAQSVVGPVDTSSYVKVAVKRADRDVWVYTMTFDAASGLPETDDRRRVPVNSSSIVVLGWPTHKKSGWIRIEVREVPGDGDPMTTYRLRIPFGDDAPEPVVYGGCT
jgi:hypothetical protein